MPDNQLHISSVNVYEFFNYPHVGRRQPGQHYGPPILFVLLNFLLFVYLVKRYLWPMVVRALEERHESYKDLLDATDRMEQKALAEQQRALERKKNLTTERENLVRTISLESEADVFSILEEVTRYERARMKETEQQIALKEEAVEKTLRQKIVRAVVRRSREQLPDLLLPSEKRSLIEAALDRSKEKRSARG